MRSLRHVLLGLVTALASTGLLLGGFSLTLTESGRMGPVENDTPSFTLTWEAFTPTPEAFTPTPEAFTPTWETVQSPTVSLTPLPPPPTSCPAPAGWIPYMVQPGDTLVSLANQYDLSVTELGGANCVTSIESLSGVVIYVPPVATPTPVPCGPPDNWIRYIVRRGDTLYRLSKTWGTTVSALQQANCLAGTSIRTGQVLYVPPGAVSYPPYDTLSPGPYETPIEIWFDIPTETPSEEASP